MNIFQKIFGNEYKKFTALLAGILTLFFQNKIGLSEEQTQNLIILLGTFFVGQGVADFGKGRALVEGKSEKK